jgi:hypothetical protein
MSHHGHMGIRQLETRAWYGQMSRPSTCSLHQEEFTFGERPRKPTIRNAWFQQWNTGEVLWWFGQQYSILLVPLLPFMAELLQGSMWAGWLISCSPLFPNNDAVLEDDNAPIHSAGTVQSIVWRGWCTSELQSPNLNIIEPLWSVLETRMRNRFPPPTYLKQLKDAPQEEWYKIPLETVQDLYESIPRRTAVVTQHHINKEMCTISVVFPLICSAPVVSLYWYIHYQWCSVNRVTAS